MDELQQLRAAVARLNEVTSRQRAQIKTLSDTLKAVNDQTQRAGATVAGLSIGFTDVPITLAKPWPDTQYSVFISIESGDGVIAGLSYGVKFGTRTTTDCIIRVQTSVALGTFGLVVVGVRK